MKTTTVTNITSRRKPPENCARQKTNFSNAPLIKGDFSNAIVPTEICTVKNLKDTIQEADQYLLATEKFLSTLEKHPGTVQSIEKLKDRRTDLKAASTFADISIQLSDGSLPTKEIRKHLENIEASLTNYKGIVKITKAHMSPPLQQEMEM